MLQTKRLVDHRAAASNNFFYKLALQQHFAHALFYHYTLNYFHHFKHIQPDALLKTTVQ